MALYDFGWVHVESNLRLHSPQHSDMSGEKV